MYNRRFKSILLSGVTAMAALAAGSAAHADAVTGTDAGTQINNTASVTYTVGGTTQSANSNTATFVVDKKVNLTVAMVNGPTQTSIGATAAVTTFKVTNLTNSVQDFKLEAFQNLISLPLVSADDFNVTNMHAYVDVNKDGIYEAGTDTATFIDELAPDTSATVFIVADVPNVAGETTAVVELKATTEDGGAAGTEGNVTQATLLGDTPGTVDTVFADGAGAIDIARDGTFSAGNAYVIGTTTVTLNKSSVVISDPVDLLVLPKAIPGALVKYCIVIHNAGLNTASGIALADAIPAHMTYAPGTITVGGVALGNTCVTDGPAEDDDTTGADESDPNGGSFDATNNIVRATLPSILPGLSTTFTFEATVN